MADPLRPDTDPSEALELYANGQSLDLVEFYDDGEWQVLLMGEGGKDVVAYGYGGNPSEARAALARNLGLG